MKVWIGLALALAMMKAHAQEPNHSGMVFLPHSEAPQVTAMATVIPSPCIAIQGEGAHILLSRDQLQALTLHHTPPNVTTAEEQAKSETTRIAEIRGDHAMVILDRMKRGKDAWGCHASVLTDPYPGKDALSLVGDLIERGQAIVIKDGASAPELRVVVSNHYGPHSGSRYFEFLGGGVFFRYTMWIE